MFKNVPPELITVDGISWVSSKVGKPLNKYVRDGVSIRVCLLRDKAIPCPEVVKVELDDGIIETIEVQRFQAREYKKSEVFKGKEAMPAEKVWVVKRSIEDKGHENATTSGTAAVQDTTDTTVAGTGVVYVPCETPDPIDVVKTASVAGTGMVFNLAMVLHLLWKGQKHQLWMLLCRGLEVGQAMVPRLLCKWRNHLASLGN
ncbi:hypothetical protein LINPERPRIM_LOCUS39322 [Linum perenne]